MIPPPDIADLISGENPLVPIAEIPPPAPENYLPAVELPLTRQPFDRNCPVHNMGKMDVLCSQCGALHWMCERLSGSSNVNPKFGTCCFSGKVKLPKLEDPPIELLNYLIGEDPMYVKGFQE